MRLLFLTALSLVLFSCGRSVPPPPTPEAIQPAQEVLEVPDIKVSTTNVRFEDVDRFEWEGTRPWQYPVHGIDVSKFQGDIDWSSAGRSGVNFAFIKATEGGDHLDERFHENWRNARNAGVLRGAYHFYYFCRTPLEQANWFIRNVPRDGNALPPVLDMEWNHLSRTCRRFPDAKTVRSEMRVFLDRVTQHYGKRPIIYSTPRFYEENELWKVRGASFWLRTVAGHPSEKYPGRSWNFWQYTSTGRVPGIEGDVDINAFSGSVTDWKYWVYYNTR